MRRSGRPIAAPARKVYGIIADYRTDLEPMKIIWDHDLPDPTKWEKVKAVPLGVESRDKSLRILGAAATEGPGLTAADKKKIYEDNARRVYPRLAKKLDAAGKR